MLNIGNHSRILQVILLHRMMGAKSEKRSGRSVARKPARVLYCRDRFIGDVLGANIPNPRFAEWGLACNWKLWTDNSPI